MASLHAPAAPVGVFIVDADPGQRRALAGLIADRADGRFTATACANPEEALAAFGSRRDAIVIADLATVGGPERIAELVRGELPLIATSANGSLSNAVAAVRGGAIDFLAKPIGAKALIDRLDATVAGWRPTPAPLPAAASAPQPAGTDFAGFIGRSQAMLAVYEQIRRVAASRAPVFITGESGTGKEICAEAIHAHPGRTDRPFVAINCSAIPRDLMESEIFGHVRGAFTGATENRTGAAELADGGTLFLDEVAEMDIGLQAKLLRFLESGSLRRVGSGETKRVDVRIVCATNRDPQAEVEAGRFRADLFYRLHVLPIHLPALRDRREDIPRLAAFFLDRFAREEGQPPPACGAVSMGELERAYWPGNVRQLANTLRRMVVLGGTVGIEPETAPVVAALAATMAVTPYWQAEREIIETAIAAFAGNVAQAAAALEISPSTIYRKREAWADRGLPAR
ncbi:sigma-54 dependent transcriptional regulator [soil metagenome]